MPEDRQDIFFSKMTIEDLPRIIEIENESFRTPWTADMFLFEMTQIPVSQYYVARDKGKGGKVLGYVCFWIFDDEVQITNIAVPSFFRRQGIGRRLVQFVVEMAKEKMIPAIFLEARISNNAALHLYRSEGFIEIGKRKKYYTDTGEDALVMKKALIY